jgi:gamma-glutamylcyclotransferase (GGCT)/AIG2-like uncharacterized protein YtfP
MGRIFVYGSLKRDCFNHGKFDFDKRTRFVKEAALHGFRMYNLGHYPCIVRTGLEEDVVHGEVFEFIDNECAALIKKMEEAVHYAEELIDIEGQKVSTYIHRRAPTHAKLVVDGNWRE